MTMKTRKQKGTMSYLSPDELLRVLRVAKEHSLRNWCMVLLSYRHGLRASEVCGLRRGDVDMKSSSITVARLKGSLKTQQPLYPHKGQPLLDEIKALKAYLAERPETGSNALFVSGKGSHLDRSAWNRIFKAIAEEAGLPAEKCHCHVLKHTLANHLVKGNVNLAFVKQSLGHANIQSTMKYLGVTDAEAAEATAKALMDIF
jgi:type 1 fimbriae regulatory protein FimB